MGRRRERERGGGRERQTDRQTETMTDESVRQANKDRRVEKGRGGRDASYIDRDRIELRGTKSEI